MTELNEAAKEQCAKIMEDSGGKYRIDSTVAAHFFRAGARWQEVVMTIQVNETINTMRKAIKETIYKLDHL